MDKHIIGEHAGTVWRLLSTEDRKWEFNEVKAATGLDDCELAAAIGWLAREDKIQFELDKAHDQAHMYLMVNVYIG